jgi:hypothetical protein
MMSISTFGTFYRIREESALRSSLGIIAALILLQCLLMTSGAIAATYYVRFDGTGSPPSYFPTIQAAIDNINLLDRDVIELIGTPFTGVGNRDVNFNGKRVTVRSQSGDPNQCVIDCQTTGRGFVFQSGEDNQAVLEAITITNGFMNNPGSGGGGILISSSSPWIKGCKIVQCSAGEMSNGGGVFAETNSSPLLTDCTIEHCSAGTWRYPATGGGICSDGTSHLTMMNCAVSSNSCDSNPIWGQGYGGGCSPRPEASRTARSGVTGPGAEAGSRPAQGE